MKNRCMVFVVLALMVITGIVGMLATGPLARFTSHDNHARVVSFERAQACSFLRLTAVPAVTKSILKRGFTLLELMIVIIIIGVLATVGIMQYQASIEKSRGMEGRQVLGSLRTSCAALYMESQNTTSCSANALRVGTQLDMVPSACRATNYFSFAVTTNTGSQLAVRATRCTTGGKNPQGKNAGTLILTTDYAAGTDAWSGTGGY